VIHISRDEELKKQGWTRQNIMDEPRLGELVEAYKDLGMEVHLEPVDPGELDDDCGECLMKDPDRYKIIYTRPKKEE
jgi:hypothetical protein